MGTAAQLFTKSMLIGLDSSLQKKQFDDEDLISEIENLPYEEAVEYLSKRSILKKDDYYKLSDKLKFRAFTVGRINDGRLLDKLNAEMIKNVNDGKGLKDFLALTKTDILNKIGMGPNQGWYWETVYRTNVQTAYNVGRAMGFEEDPPIALEFVGIDDARQTDTCSSLSGVIRPYDDPFWEGHTPPLHFNCRSTLRGIYDESELPEKWSNVGDVETAAKGFGSWPTENDSWWEELASQTKAAKYYGVQGEIEAAKEILLNETGKIDFNLYSKKVISVEELKEVDLVKQKFIENKFFLETTEKYLSLEGIDAKSAKMTYEAYENVFNKYPKIKGIFPSIKTKLLNEKVFAKTDITFGGKQVYLNRLFFKDNKVLEDLYEKTVQINFHPKGTTAIANIYHEIAHCIDSLLTERMTSKQRKKYLTFSAFAQSKIFRMTKLSLDDILENVSSYATRKPEEWFAECFAEFMNSNSPREMSRTLELFLRSYL